MGPGGVCKTGACPGNGENAGVDRDTNGAAAHGEDSNTIGCDGRCATLALNGGPLAALLLVWSSISQEKSAERERRNELFKNCQYIYRMVYYDERCAEMKSNKLT